MKLKMFALSIIICLLAALATAWLMLYEGKPTSMAVLLDNIPFMLLVVSPYLTLAVISYLCRNSLVAISITLADALLIAGFGCFVLYDGFFVHLDPQSAILFVVVPFYQWLTVVTVMFISFGLHRRKVKREAMVGVIKSN